MIQYKPNVGIMVFAFPHLSETFILNQMVYLKQKGYRLKIFAFQERSLQNAQEEVSDYGLISDTSFFWKGSGKKVDDLLGMVKAIWIKNRWKIWGRSLQGLSIFRGKNISKRVFYYLQWLYLPELEEQDILHVHFGDVALFPAALKSAGLLKNTRLMVSFHGYDLVPSEKTYNQKRYQNLFRYTELVTVNSLFTLQLFNDVAGKHFSGHIELLHESMDCLKFVKGNQQRISNKSQLLFCGRMVQWKAPDLAIKIFSEVLRQYQGEKQLSLIIIGSGPMQEELRDMIDSLGIADKVNLVGRKTQLEIKSLLDNSSVFLYPGITDPKTGRAENQGLVVQEAQAMQLPVVTSTAGGIKEGIINGETGFIVEEGDIQGFVVALLLMIEDDELRIMMGERGREWVNKKFDVQVLGKQLETLYQGLS